MRTTYRSSSITSLLKLRQFAHKKAARKLSQAAGRCLVASLTLANRAKELGLDHEFVMVRWDVVGDPNYAEHWAVEHQSGQVFDLTAVQVFNDVAPLRTIAQYPENYLRPVRYPTQVVASAFTAIFNHNGERLPTAYLWKAQMELCFFDLRRFFAGLNMHKMYFPASRAIRATVFLLTSTIMNWALYRLAHVLAKAR